MKLVHAKRISPAFAAAAALACLCGGEARAQCSTGTVPPTTLFESDFEREDAACWGTVPNSGCGAFSSIAPKMSLYTGGAPRARSGSKSLKVTHDANETYGHANLPIRATDTLVYRAYYYFDADFDFGQGMKIARFMSRAQDSLYQDLLLQIRSASSSGNTTLNCGTNPSNDVGIFHNSGSGGFAPVTASYNFVPGQWYAIKVLLIYNKVGQSDGRIAMWVNGSQLFNQTGLSFRGTLPATVKFSDVYVGGWYSNSANNNACPPPSPNSYYYIDDALIASADENINPGENNKVFLFQSGLENEDAACWNVSTSRSACGAFRNIAAKMSLNTSSSFAKDGSKSLKVVHDANETYGHAQVNFAPTDTLWYSADYYFASTFDFPQGMKIARFMTYASSNPTLYNDILLQVRSAQNGSVQCGATASADIGIFHNGGAATGAGFGPLTVNQNLSTNTWYNFKVKIIYNRVGFSDGSMALYINGTQAASANNLTNRGNMGSSIKFNQVLAGGWYSNSANGNTCIPPSAASTYYIDNIRIGKVDPD